MFRLSVVRRLGFVAVLAVILAGVTGTGTAAGPPICNCCSGGNNGLGCNCQPCEEIVCDQDPFCCESAWDPICDSEAARLCTCCTDGCSVGCGDEGGSATAGEITFECFEVDLGQDVTDIIPIAGDEWLGFGIDMIGEILLIYGPPNFPDPFPGDNGVVASTDPSTLDIVFTSPVSGLEVDWWSPGGALVTLSTFDADDNLLEEITHPDQGMEQFATDPFQGSVSRLEVKSSPAVCVANLRFEETNVPAMSRWGLTGTAVLLLTALTAVAVWRRRSAA